MASNMQNSGSNKKTQGENKDLKKDPNHTQFKPSKENPKNPIPDDSGLDPTPGSKE